MNFSADKDMEENKDFESSEKLKGNCNLFAISYDLSANIHHIKKSHQEFQAYFVKYYDISSFPKDRNDESPKYKCWKKMMAKRYLNKNLNNPFNCNICKKSFPLMASLYYHKKKYHHPLYFMATKADLKSLIPKNTERKYQCFFCKYKTRSKSLMDRHILKHYSYRYTHNGHQTDWSNKEINFLCGNLTDDLRLIHKKEREEESVEECSFSNFMGEEWHGPRTENLSHPEMICDQNENQHEHTGDLSEDTPLSDHNNYDPLNESDQPSSTSLNQSNSKRGRFVKLVSDFDDFADCPYACALCYQRFSQFNQLRVHVENHLTGAGALHNNQTTITSYFHQVIKNF